MNNVYQLLVKDLGGDEALKELQLGKAGKPQQAVEMAMRGIILVNA